ncbi:response regulator transcription factor [Anaeromicropila herbilytica]|uniref:Stage 0 sporulation protein A homolog n=1 Tax=Anaeromicropila herbilytica TaxID=2785025 RepID=A0A7R7EPA0_9FIRM|nr:helix-turn-helix domain-containing protein [Anaeromicropila herbilytica]BCN32472.1 DNA-binding response regulator [Anaeromicropila herbilytica]
MIKVLLIDEFSVYQDITNLISLEKEGFEVIGEVYDGELALPIIRETKPDLIIVDINIPVLNGLQLSKLVLDEMPWIKIILLSSINEFKYAKDAINIGITYFVQKPIESSELIASLVRVRNLIYTERVEKANAELSQQVLDHNKTNNLQTFYTSLVTNDINLHDILEKSKTMNIDLVAKCYNIILCQINQKEIHISIHDERVIDLLHYIENNLKGDFHIIHCILPHGIMAYLIKGSDHKTIESNIDKIVHNIQLALQKYQNMEYFIAVGSEVNRLSELKKCYDSASKAFSYRYFIGKNQVFYSDSSHEYRIIKHSEIDLGNVNVSKLDKSCLERYLRIGLKCDTKKILREYFSNLDTQNLNSFLFRHYIIYDIYFLCISISEELGMNSNIIIDQCGNPQNLCFSNSNLEEIINYFENVFEVIFVFRETHSTQKYQSLLINAKEYINQYYSNEDISLQKVANHVNISPSYFSTIFSQQVGQKFIDYLTDIRMKKAKELLSSSSMKISEIGYAVGYNDPHYFSFIFKKAENVTPKEYRANKR